MLVHVSYPAWRLRHHSRHPLVTTRQNLAARVRGGVGGTGHRTMAANQQHASRSKVAVYQVGGLL